MNNNILTNRHDIYFIFEVTNGNPNGDPDMDNMPRQEDNTEKGLVSDVCLKRKIRNYVFLSNSKEEVGRRIFVQNTHYLNDVIEEHHKNSTERLTSEGLLKNDAKDKKNNKKSVDIATVESLCREFFDIRTFGAVVATGKMAGSPFGQIQGPVQVTFAQSFDPITPQQITITRQAKTDEKEEKPTNSESEDSQTGGGTMGNKFIVPYGLYAAKIYVSPAFAERTGFTSHDLEVLFEALSYMFEHDRSASRGEMIIRGIYDFEHIGTQHENNAEANKREARLGCCHAHKLFEGINVKLKDGKEFPESFNDYEVNCSWTDENLPKGVTLHKRHE